MIVLVRQTLNHVQRRDGLWAANFGTMLKTSKNSWIATMIAAVLVRRVVYEVRVVLVISPDWMQRSF